MGKGSTTKRPTRGVSKTNTNCESKIANLKKIFKFVILLCLSGVFAQNVFAQNEVELYFIEKISNGNTEEKRDALFKLRNFETEKASRIALPALRDDAEIVRATAAFSVIFLPPDEAAQSLLPLLKDKSELVRREAAYALGKVQNPNTINALAQILQNDKVLEVRGAAAVALGEIGNASAVDELLKILQKKQKDEEEFLRRSAARSIGQIARIIQTNEVQVITPESFLPDRFDQIKKPKYTNLTEKFPIFRSANNLLIQILQNPRAFESVKREAAFALGEIGDVSSIPVLQANINAKDYYLAEIAQESLRKISGNSRN